MNKISTGTTTKNALILSGDGARSAYQVGVLKAIAELLPGNNETPFPLRALDKNGSSLVSYLMFEKPYCCELIELGYNDAMARKQELIEFFDLD